MQGNKELSVKIREVSQHLIDQSNEARNNQLGFHENISHQLKKLRENAEEMLNKSASEIENMISEASKSLGNTHEHSQNIAGQISEIVMTIQFHDIIRQEVEHLVEVLYEALNHYKNQGQDLNTKIEVVTNFTLNEKKLAAGRISGFFGYGYNGILQI